MSDRPTDATVSWLINVPGWVGELAREVQARRLSDITTPICPTCNGIGGTSGSIPYNVARWKTPCKDCNETGHIPLKVWVGMLTDALRDSWQSEFPAYLNIERVLGLADSVTPKEGT